MSRGLITSVVVVCVFLEILSAQGIAQDVAPPSPAETSVADPAAQAKIQQFMEGDSVFIENAGQWPDFIRFALDSRGANVGITDHGPRFQLFRKAGTVASEQPLGKAGTVASERPLGSETGLSPVSGSETGSETVPSPASVEAAPEAAGPFPDPKSETPAPSEMHEFALVFDGAAVVTPAGRGHSDRKFNYLVGDASNHREGVGSFDAVWYENLYPGISLEMTGRRSGVKYNFHVAPGADARVLRMRYEGIDGLSLKEDGALEINIAEGWLPLTDGAPYIYQKVNGEKRTVAGRFSLLDSHTYGFEVTGDFDPTLPLVIDPEVAWGSYLGGAEADQANGVALDGNGDCYVTGSTASSGWVGGGWDTEFAGTLHDGFVVKLSATGAHLWSTYLGGPGEEYGWDIATDANGACFATGSTASADWVSGGWDTSFNGNYDGYLVKLDSAGAHAWSTYLGGTANDYGFGVAVDGNGACHICGFTGSSGWVSGGWDVTYAGGTDAFVMKVSGAGAHLWSTYLGGAALEHGYGITVDANGNCYATGQTKSAGWVSGGWDTEHGGTDYSDAYVVKLNVSGMHVWSSYVGGPLEDLGHGVAADASGNCLVTGNTLSSDWVAGGWDLSLGGAEDGFVTKLDNMGGHVWSTYVGGTTADRGRRIAGDGTGNFYVTGYTNSPGWVAGGWDTILGGGSYSWDGFILKLSGGGAHLWSGYVGGADYDLGQDVAVDGSGTGYAVGSARSAGWMDGGWDTVLNDGVTTNDDGYVVRFSDADLVGSLQVTLTPAAVVAAGAQWRRAGTETWRNSGETEANVPAGTRAVEFKAVNGWPTPLTRSVEVPVNGTGHATAGYIFGVTWSTYLGGTSTDSGNGIALDGNNDWYVVGTTSSNGWISGGWDTTLNSTDAYVMKLSNDGIPVWSSYIGGTGTDYGNGIALDSNNACYVVGNTNSSGWVSGGWKTTYAGGTDGYVVKLNSSGGYEWSSYLGGTSVDYGNGIAVDTNGACFAVGTTKSSGWVDGGSSGTLTYSYGYVVKLNSMGEHIWSKYSFGGLGDDYAYAVAVNSAGDCYVAGSHVWYNYHNINIYRWGIILIIESDGTELLGAAGLPGHVYGIAVDNNDIFYAVLSSGNVYKSGDMGWSKPITEATYGKGIAIDSQGNCYITGNTTTSGWVNGGWDTSYNGGYDGFVLKLNSAGDQVWSSYLGNTGDDYGYGIAVDSTGATIGITGSTNSSGWISGGWQTTYSGNTDAFVAKIVDMTLLPIPPSAPGASVIDLDTITWTWQDNSDDETGFNVYAGAGGMAPDAVTYTTGANVESWQQDGLAPNTQCAMRVAATNDNGDSAKTANYTAWTLVEPVAGLVFNTSPTSVTVASVNAPSNLAQGVSGLQFANTTTSQISSWQQNATPWVSAGLTPNVLYGFSGQSRNGAGLVTTPAADSTHTLAADPSPGNNILADKTPGTAYLAGTEFNFVNPAGFGAGTHGGNVFMVSVYRYAWNTEAVYVFTGAESIWNAGGLTEAPTVSGTYYLHLQSLNEADVAGGTLAYGPFVLDLDAPGAPWVSGPAVTNNPQPTWTWSSGGGGNSTYRYDLDASGVWVETTDVAFTPAAGLGDGPHLLQVQERDDAGNWSPDGSFEITVDTILAAAPVVSGPAFTNNPRPTWMWISGGGGNGTYRYELDASGVWVETTDVTFTPAVGLGQGPHILQVQERDDAGNWSASGSFSIVVDTTPPAPPAVLCPALTNNPTPTWTWISGGGGNGTYRYDLDASGVWVETTDAAFTPVTVLGDGTHTLRVQERDDAGNWSADGSFGIVVDTAAPAAPVVTGPALTNDPTPTWAWTSGGGGGNGTYRYDLDASGTWTETTGTAFTSVTVLGDGTHTLRVQERDDAGNWSADGSFEIVVDTAAPPAPVVSGPALTNDPTPTWTWTSGGGGGNGTYRYDLDASGVWIETTAVAFTPATDPGDGTHTLLVQERDDAGNWSADGSHGLEINTAELTATLDLSGPVETGADSVAFAVTFSENVASTFDLSVISVTGSLAGDVSVGGMDPDYVVTVTLTGPDADGTVGIAVAGGLVQDAYGNVYVGGVSPEYRIYNWLEPWFTEMPAGARKYTGDDHVFSATANCSAASLTYQWRWNDGAKAEYPGPASSSWNLSGLTPGQSGSYWCEASYDGMTHATTPVTLQVMDPLEIVTPPLGGTEFEGDTHEFSVTVSGGYDPLHYQWRKDGAVVPEAPDSSSWTLSTLTQEDSGSYTVVVTDDNGMSVESTAAVLQVERGLAGPNAVLLAALILLLALFGSVLLRHAVAPQNL